MPSNDALKAIDNALEAILTARVSLGPMRALKPPTEALDTALAADAGFKAMRQRFSVAMATGDLLGVEAAANQLAARAVEVGFEVASSMYINTKEDDR